MLSLAMDIKPASRRASQTQNFPQLNLLELPIELFEEILSYLTYDKISQNRLVIVSCCVTLYNKCLLFFTPIGMPNV